MREVSSSIVGSWACVTAEPSRSASASSVRSRSSSARVRRSRSIARRLAVVVSQAAGSLGHAVARPRGQRDGVGVLQCVLGEREIPAEMADERRQDAGAVLAGGPLERAGGRQSKTTTGRTSTDPYVMFGIFAAQPSAASRSSTSIR